MVNNRVKQSKKQSKTVKEPFMSDASHSKRASAVMKASYLSGSYTLIIKDFVFQTASNNWK